MSTVSSVLSNQQLVKLKEHKYSSINNSVLDRYMNPFWNWLTLYVPETIHPNSLTLGGLVVNFATTLILVYYSPDGKTSAPRWTYLANALGIFVYQTLDAIDGKHARRTGTSSPLGELFDHGCDSLSTLFVTLGVCITLNLGEEPLWFFFYMFSALAIYYLAHWQTYVTGSLQFGKFDVTEIQFTCIALHLVSFIGGSDVWMLLKIPMTLITFRVVAEWVMVVGTLGNIWNKGSIILNGGPGRNGSAVGNMSIIAPMFPLVFVLWQAYYIHNHSDVAKNHIVLFIFAFGIIFAKICNKLVMAHMTQSEMRFLDTCYIVPVIMASRHYWDVLKWIPEHWLLWICVLQTSVDLLWYCTRICIGIRDYLGIRVFSMAPFSKPETSRTADLLSQQRRVPPARINLGKDANSVRQPRLPKSQL